MRQVITFQEAPQRLRMLVNVLRLHAGKNGLSGDQNPVSFLASLDILRKQLIERNPAYESIMLFEPAGSGELFIHARYEGNCYLIRMTQKEFPTNEANHSP